MSMVKNCCRFERTGKYSKTAVFKSNSIFQGKAQLFDLVKTWGNLKFLASKDMHDAVPVNKNFSII